MHDNDISVDARILAGSLNQQAAAVYATTPMPVHP